MDSGAAIELRWRVLDRGFRATAERGQLAPGRTERYDEADCVSIDGLDSSVRQLRVRRIGRRIPQES